MKGSNVGALSGVRVIDLTQFEAGTSCTQALAWLGAEVIKVEEPKKGEQGRLSSTGGKPVDSYYFIVLNSNKKSITLNLKMEEGKRILRDLIREGDIFIENFSPGVIERLGFGYDAVKAINPRMIYAQIKGFAPGSPYANYKSFDMIAQAAGGVLSITGEYGGRPLKAGATVGDTGTGLHCLAGVLAALYQREKSGIGQQIEVVMQEAVTNFSRMSYAKQLMSDGTPCDRTGNQSLLGATAPSEAYSCKGGGPNDYCFIYTSRAGSAQWHALLTVIGRKDLIGDDRFESPERRYQHRELVDEAIISWTSRHDKHTVMKTLGDAGVPAGAVLDTSELSNDPHMRRRGVFVEIDHPDRGNVVIPAWPVHMSSSNVKVEPAPKLGRDTDQILGDLLGLSEADLQAMRKSGIV